CVTAFTRLYKLVLEHKNGETTPLDLSKNEEKFLNAVNDNLNLPLALSSMWDVAKIAPRNKNVYKTLLKFDEALGLDLINAEAHLKEEPEEIPEDIIELAKKRWEAKTNKDWATADKLREELKSLGYAIKDTSTNYEITKL
ncbi:MAG: cysteine--tRNA ligase, partial [Christensenellales bacterium]